MNLLADSGKQNPPLWGLLRKMASGQWWLRSKAWTQSLELPVYIYSFMHMKCPTQTGAPQIWTDTGFWFFKVLLNCSGTTQFESSITPPLWITGGSKTLQSNSISAAFLLPVDPDAPGVSLETDTSLWCQMTPEGFQRCARGARMLMLFRSPRQVFSHSQTALIFEAKSFFPGLPFIFTSV